MPHKLTRHSLSVRAMCAILLLSVLLSVAAILAGYLPYRSMIRSQYADKAGSVAQTVAALADAQEVAQFAERLRSIRQDDSDEMPAFQRDETFESLRSMLESIRLANNVQSITIGMDGDTNEPFFVLVDAQDHMAPGESLGLGANDLEHFRRDAREDYRTRFQKEEDGTFACQGIAELTDDDGEKVANILVRISADEVRSNCHRFLWILSALMLTLVAGETAALVRMLRRRVVSPINTLAVAATQYCDDRQSGTESGAHFTDLGIRTGDEIERLGDTFAEMEKDLDAYIGSVRAVTAEKERFAAELDIAGRIQTGMLPNIFPPYPDRTEIDIFASMRTAKEVGGDFYDFFMPDDDHLCLVMADVSGKGIPAALFMMSTKMLLSNAASADFSSPAHILERVNAQICRSNREDMFVTVWLGVLELSTGVLKAANAGHEFPVIRHSGDAFALYRDPHGLVVGAMPGSRYREYTVQLQRGDALFLYTDGVPEANDPQNAQFGCDRMLDALNRIPDTDARAYVEGVQQAVDAFTNDAGQFDDITMLCVRYAGREEELCAQ